MKKIIHKRCDHCNQKQEFILKVGQIWINDNDYKVKILDFGDRNIWLLYLENSNKCEWDQNKFLNQYRLYNAIK